MIMHTFKQIIILYYYFYHKPCMVVNIFYLSKLLLKLFKIQVFCIIIIIVILCMPMYILTSVQKGYLVNDLVVDWG